VNLAVATQPITTDEEIPAIFTVAPPPRPSLQEVVASAKEELGYTWLFALLTVLWIGHLVSRIRQAGGPITITTLERVLPTYRVGFDKLFTHDGVAKEGSTAALIAAHFLNREGGELTIRHYVVKLPSGAVRCKATVMRAQLATVEPIAV
jgi:hypothetical protein